MNENEGLITIENSDHILKPGEYVKIEFMKKDVRSGYYPKGVMMEKSKALALVKKGLAKLKLVSRPEKADEPVKVKWTNKVMRGKYENDVCHMSREKAQRLQDQGYLKIIKDLQS